MIRTLYASILEQLYRQLQYAETDKVRRANRELIKYFKKKVCK